MFPKTAILLFDSKVGRIQVDVYALTHGKTSLYEDIVKLLEELSSYIEGGVKIYENHIGKVINDEIMRNTLQAEFGNMIFPDVAKERWYHGHVRCSEINNPPSQLNFLPRVSIQLSRNRSISQLFLDFKPLGIEG